MGAWCAWLLPAAACLAAGATPASAPIIFNLPADEFPRAMLEFYRQAHVSVVFSSIRDLRSIHTRPVAGELEPMEALRRMLDGTPLTFSVDPDGVVIIKRLASVPPPQAVAAAGAAPAPAPHAVPQAGVEPITPVKVEEVRVTGSLIHGEEAGAPLLTVTPRDIGLGAYPTIQDAFYQLPMNSLTAPRQDLDNSKNFSWGSGLNLRGLGVGATLVLVDGQRQALSGYNGSFVDVSNIPASIVERVEILPDGASALYGSDAIAGVVNIILRKDIEGAETSVHLGSAAGGRRDVTVSQIGGLHWSGGRVVLAYQYFDDTPLLDSARGYAASADKAPYGGGDYRSFYASPGTLLDPSTSQPLGTPDLQNPFAQSDLFPDIRQHNFYARVSQDVTDGLQLFAAARFTRRDTLSQEEPFDQVLAVPSSNPYYRQSLWGNISGLVAYSFLSDLGPERAGSVSDSYNGLMGADMELGGGWHATLTGSRGGESLKLTRYGEPDQGQLASALASPNVATAFDPFGATPAGTVASINRDFLWHADTSLTEGSLIADGPLGDLPAGPLQLAVGVERRDETLQHDVPDPANPLEATVSQSYGRSIQAAFTELSVPLVPGRQGVPAAPSVQLQLAGRYESYSDFGDTFNPSTRLTWLAAPWLKVRGSWGRSFRAPTLDDLHDNAQNSTSYVMLSVSGSPSSQQKLYLVEQGDNPNLREETATTWTAGFDLTPTPSTQVSLTYYNIAYQNQITVPAAGDPYSVLFDSDLWASVITPHPTAAEVSNACNAPGLGSRDACKARPADIIDLRLANLSKTLVQGLDVQGHQLLDTTIGHFDLGAAGAYLFQFAEGATSASLAQPVLNTVGNPMAFRLRATLDWNQLSTGSYGWGATLGYDYMSGYRDPGSMLVPEVDAFGSFDVQVRYRWPQLELRVNAVNILNQSPPFVDNQYGYDRFNTQPLGRVLGVTVAKSW